MSKSPPTNLSALFKTITTFVFDVDGVMTDGSLQLLETGELSRTMHIRDGYALQLAVKKGYRVAVISGGRSPSVEKRLRGLGIPDIYLRVQDKKEKLDDYLLIQDIGTDELLYMGDDIPDYEVLQMAGLPACPSDAAPEIKAICNYISPYGGGKGCVRDVIEKVLKLRGDW